VEHAIYNMLMSVFAAVASSEQSLSAFNAELTLY